jgi:hypothetical protein
MGSMRRPAMDRTYQMPKLSVRQGRPMSVQFLLFGALELMMAGYSQCQPLTSNSPPPKNTPKPSSNVPNQPTTSTRTRRTWTGRPNPQPTTTTRQGTSTRPAGPAPSVVQLYDQCGGQTYTGPTRCVEGLTCVKVDDFYSQCQKP